MPMYKWKSAIKDKSLKNSLLWGIGIWMAAFFIIASVLLNKYPSLNLERTQFLETAEFQNCTVSDDGTLVSESIDPIIIIPTETIKNVRAVEVDIAKMSEDLYNGQIFLANASLWQEKSCLFRQGINNIYLSNDMCTENLDYVRLDLCETAGAEFVIDRVTINPRGRLLKHSFMDAGIYALISFLLIYSLYCYKDAALKRKIIVQIIIYMYSLCTIFFVKAVPSINEDYIFKMLLCLLSFSIGRDTYEAFAYYKQHRMRKGLWILFVITGLAVSFSFTGNHFFYNDEIGYFETSAAEIMKYMLVFIYSLILCNAVSYWIAVKNMKTSRGEEDIHKNVFFIFLSSGLIYLAAYNPANMFSDTYWQLKQVFGIGAFKDWHPVFHTLILKLFIAVFHTPAVFAFFHIFLFAYVMAKWMQKLYLKGLNKKIIYIFSCSFYFNIAYGLLITNIWKDNLYNICLIWCTYFIYEMIDDFQHFDAKRSNYVYFSLSVIGVFCCRHNGIIPIAGIMVFLVLYFRKTKSKKKFYLLCALFLAVILVKKPLYRMLNVIPNDPGVLYTPLVHDIASVIVYNSGNSLSDPVMEQMESILSIEQWSQNFDATDSDPYTFHVDEYMKNLNKKSINDILTAYFGALKDEPLRIICARLMSSQVMWSTFKRDGSNDYLFEKNNTPDIEKRFGYVRKENVFTQLFNRIYDIFENSKILNTVFFRTGIWFCVLLFSITAAAVYVKNKNLLCATVPIISNMASLAVSMTCQHLRYVWALYIISILFLFIVMLDKNSASRREINGQDSSIDTLL